MQDTKESKHAKQQKSPRKAKLVEKPVKKLKPKKVHTSGKRKHAIARATIKPGKGIYRINKILLSNYMPYVYRMRIMEPLILSGDIASKIDINANAHGGGISSQSEALRLAIARGLVLFSESKQLKQKFLDYDRNLLVADVRRNEPHKPNDSKPRAARQKSYR